MKKGKKQIFFSDGSMIGEDIPLSLGFSFSSFFLLSLSFRVLIPLLLSVDIPFSFGVFMGYSLYEHGHMWE